MRYEKLALSNARGLMKLFPHFLAAIAALRTTRGLNNLNIGNKTFEKGNKPLNLGPNL